MDFMAKVSRSDFSIGCICKKGLKVYICTPKKPQKTQRSGRAVECGGLENRWTARFRGFESLLLCWVSIKQNQSLEFVMESRFFVFQTYPKESFFSIRKVGIREPDKSLEVYSRILRLNQWSPTSSFIGHLDFRFPAKYIFQPKTTFYEHCNECVVLDSQGQGVWSKWSADIHAHHDQRSTIWNLVQDDLFFQKIGLQIAVALLGIVRLQGQWTRSWILSFKGIADK